MNTISTKYLVIVAAVAFVILLGLVYFVRPEPLMGPSNQQTSPQNEGGNGSTPTDASARSLVTGFGDQLQKVSLLAPNASASMEEFYGPYVAPELLAQWQSDPSKAPGRQTSSPWPDHFEIGDVEKTPIGYIVRGQIVFMTSNEVTNGGTAGIQDVTMTLGTVNGKLLITNYAAGQFGRGGGS